LNLDELLAEMIERTCRCGCGYTFRVLPGSAHFYASILHNPNAVNLEVTVWQRRKRPAKVVVTDLLFDSMTSSFAEGAQS
jgi:hypothetical protein